MTEEGARSLTEETTSHLNLIFDLGKNALQDVLTPCPYRIWVGMNGVERAWDGEAWRRVQPGTFLARLVGPAFRELGDPARFMQAVNSLPLPEGRAETPKAAFSLRAFHFVQAMECIRLLVPAPNRARYKEGPGMAKRMLAAMAVDDMGVRSDDLAAWLAFRPLHFWLSAAWQGSHPRIDCRDGQFGFEIQAHNVWTAALAEGLLLILFNVRRIRSCPHCRTLHWDKRSSVCKDCRRQQDRQRKAKRPKTLADRFRDRVSHAKCRKRLTEDQAMAVLETLRRKGLSAAERLYESLRLRGRKGRISHAQEEG